MSSCNLCRRISINITDSTNYSFLIDKITSVVVACNNLLHVDISFKLDREATHALKSAWFRLGSHLSKLNIDTLRLKFEIHTTASEYQGIFHPVGGFLFSVLTSISSKLTHLTIAQIKGDLDYFPFFQFPRFPRLGSFTFSLKMDDNGCDILRPFTENENNKFWTSLQTTKLQFLELSGACRSFSWNNERHVILPSSLTKLVITLPPIYRVRCFNPLFILKHFPNLHILIINTSDKNRSNYEGLQSLGINTHSLHSVLNETIHCRDLHTFQIRCVSVEHLLETVIRQCHNLRDVAISEYSTDSDLFTLAVDCKLLTTLEIGIGNDGVTVDGLRHLCHLKHLSWICLSNFVMTILVDEDVFKRWARELPLLRRVVLRTSDIQFEEVVSDDGVLMVDEMLWISIYLRQDERDGIYVDMTTLRRDLVCSECLN